MDEIPGMPDKCRVSYEEKMEDGQVGVTQKLILLGRAIDKLVNIQTDLIELATYKIQINDFCKIVQAVRITMAYLEAIKPEVIKDPNWIMACNMTRDLFNTYGPPRKS